MLIKLWFFILGCKQTDSIAPKSQPTNTLPYFNSPEFTPHWLQPDQVPQDFHRVPEFALINQNGNTITEKDLDNKITVVDFFFTSCPGICPRLTKNMAVIDEAFGENENLLLLSHSVTPDNDTIDVLKEYAQDRDIDAKRWHLLTGDRNLIYHLGRNVYFVEEDLGKQKGPDDFLHTENFILIDKNRHIRGVYNGLNKTSVNHLIADIKIIQGE